MRERRRPVSRIPPAIPTERALVGRRPALRSPPALQRQVVTQVLRQRAIALCPANPLQALPPRVGTQPPLQQSKVPAPQRVTAARQAFRSSPPVPARQEPAPAAA